MVPRSPLPTVPTADQAASGPILQPSPQPDQAASGPTSQPSPQPLALPKLSPKAGQQPQPDTEWLANLQTPSKKQRHRPYMADDTIAAADTASAAVAAEPSRRADTLRKVKQKMEDKLAKTGQEVGKVFDKMKLSIRGSRNEAGPA